MTLRELTADLNPLVLNHAEAEIRGLTDDSRLVRPGFAFVATAGLRRHGLEFLEDALARGTSAVITDRKISLPEGIGLCVLPRLKEHLPLLAGRFYDFPEKKLKLIGVTGTNGKTSVTFFVRDLLEHLGEKTGVIGTVGYFWGEEGEPALHTTPGPFKLREVLARMQAAGATYVAMEASSHALSQGRLAGLSFEIGVFTNFSRDHLDYHGNMENYFEAKKLLFKRHLSPQGKAVINVADTWGRRLLADLLSPVIKVGEDLRGIVSKRSRQGFSFRLVFGSQEYELATTLYGDFQLENLLLACSCGLALGYPFEEVVEALKTIKAPPGRLELIAQKEGALVFVDYAHTPAALERALQSLRPLAKRLLVVFGCGGERDSGKRPLMGEAAERIADLVILTSDNPRGEDPRKIISDIVSGMKNTPIIVEDRREAIETALSLLKDGDILLVAGKGHETYQEIAGKRYPFSDRALIREILAQEAA
ncbi:MAG: UDP-N-acetylmuramoyl-L-alanyl-D-glutamate--2,6-diaminopimelate ligase [Thermodesulfobacteria bacterium]|nr:UDP-N-acetylmuramoyl-L-alanyl-D-glutamate--2,6-diaminopimelate ligase [Thermodesulfobacteriota bacterium]